MFPYWFFCLDYLSINVIGVLKSTTFIVLLFLPWNLLIFALCIQVLHVGYTSIYIDIYKSYIVLLDWPLYYYVKVKVTELCSTLCDSMGYTVQGILQARILEWVAFPFSKRSSQLRDQSRVSRIAGGFFTSWATREVQGPYKSRPRAESDLQTADSFLDDKTFFWNVWKNNLYFWS